MAEQLKDRNARDITFEDLIKVGWLHGRFKVVVKSSKATVCTFQAITGVRLVDLVCCIVFELRYW